MIREYIVQVSDELDPKAFERFENSWSPEELVRCKDCKHRPTYPKAYGAEIGGKWCYWCELNKFWAHDNWFCGDGEKEVKQNA